MSLSSTWSLLTIIFKEEKIQNDEEKKCWILDKLYHAPLNYHVKQCISFDKLIKHYTKYKTQNPLVINELSECENMSSFNINSLNLNGNF